MGKLQKIFFAVFVLSAVVYGFMRTVYIIGDGVVAFASDKDNQVIANLKKGVNVIPQGLFRTVTVHYVPMHGTSAVEIFIPLPQLELLKSQHYSIHIPVTVAYSLHADTLAFNRQHLYAQNNYLSELLRVRLVDSIYEHINKYLQPVYQHTLLRTNIQKELLAAIAAVKESCARDGLIIHEISTGSVLLPNYTVYAEGRRFLMEMLQQEKINSLRLNSLQQKLKEDELSSQQRLQYLEKMSGLISKNKEILKYIYIDKLADNVRVIVTSEENTPIDVMANEDSESIKKDLDNFKRQ